MGESSRQPRSLISILAERHSHAPVQDGHSLKHGRREWSWACSCSPGPLWVNAEGIKEVLNSHRSHERTFVQPNSIAFPGINTPEGLFNSPCGPKNVARKVTAIHCVSKDISELVSLLISLPRDGESVPTLVSTPICLNVRE